MNRCRYIAAIVVLLTSSLVFTGCPSNTSVTVTSNAVNNNAPTEITNEGSSVLDDILSNITELTVIEEHGTTVTEDIPETTIDVPISEDDVQPLRVHFIDVGQGDSIFIEFPNAQTMLIDAGERGYDATVLDYLWGLGYTEIDYAVGTHAHSDHIGGLPGVLRNIPADTVYLSPREHNTKIYEELLDVIEKQVNAGGTFEMPSAGDVLIDEKSIDLKLTVVAPEEKGIDNVDLNNSSLMLRLDYNDSSFLFTGDAEADEEADIVKLIDVDVLKVGHHGSDTSSSSAFIQRVTPEIAVISCGKDNKYGHPIPSILERLATFGATIYRTDESGTIVITTTGKDDYEIDTVMGTSADIVVDDTYTYVEDIPVDENLEEPLAPVNTDIYVLNRNTMKVHRYSCRYVEDIAPANYVEVSSLDGLAEEGYAACKVCDPVM